jgi:filamentous hemagglutinin
LSQEPKITGSSSFPDRATAERAVSEAIDINQVQIPQSLSGKGKTLVLKYDSGHYVGNIISKNKQNQ